MNVGDLAGKRCLRLMSSSGQEIVGLGYSARPMAAVAGLNVFGLEVVVSGVVVQKRWMVAPNSR
jgi:hypothetical protein